MTDKEYLNKMVKLTYDLDRIANTEPLIQEEWDTTMDELHRVTCVWHASRRCTPWFFSPLCWFLLGILAGVLLVLSIS